MESLITVFAGLGLFFVGIKLIGSNLKQMAGRRFRTVVARAVAHPVAAAALGVVTGALTQSTNAVTFISINTVTAGLVKQRDVLPVIIWANVGTSALVLLATLDLHLAVLFLVGCVGVLFYFELDKSARLRHVVGTLLSIGLLFLGIDFIHEGADGLRQMASVQSAVDYARNSYLFAFLVGVVITAIAQSSATVTVVAVAMIKAGLLDIDQAIFIVYGAGVGSGIGVLMISLKLHGTSRQLSAVQVATKWLGAAVLVPLLALELWTGWPLVKALAGTVSANVETQPAWIYLFYQVVSAVIMTLLLDPVHAAVRRLFPETLEENLSKPRYIYTGGGIEAETGLLLVEREQERQVGYIRDSLDWVREDADAALNRPKPDLLHRAAQSIGGEVEAFLTELMESAPQRETMERLTRLYAAQGLLDELSGEVHKLVARVSSAETVTVSLAPAVAGMVESLHLIVVVLGEELTASNEFQRTSLATMTSDRSDMMDRLRRELTRGDRALTKAEQATLFAVTTHFEHVVWLIRRYLTLVRTVEEAAA